VASGWLFAINRLTIWYKIQTKIISIRMRAIVFKAFSEPSIRIVTKSRTITNWR
jgi:hypothetical protein